VDGGDVGKVDVESVNTVNLKNLEERKVEEKDGVKRKKEPMCILNSQINIEKVL
tara:strand:- start:366 stop:527 length:162 start_codon:yes stop_codon:yes gene_type:complete